MAHRVYKQDHIAMDLQNAFAEQANQMQQSMQNQLQGLLNQGQGFNNISLGVNPNNLNMAVPEEYYTKAISGMGRSINYPKNTKLSNENWLDSEVTKYTGNLQ